MKFPVLHVNMLVSYFSHVFSSEVTLLQPDTSDTLHEVIPANVGLTSKC